MALNRVFSSYLAIAIILKILPNSSNDSVYFSITSRFLSFCLLLKGPSLMKYAAPIRITPFIFVAKTFCKAFFKMV